MNPMLDSDKYSGTLSEGMGFVLGDGKLLKFWEDEWPRIRLVGWQTLKVSKIATGSGLLI